MGDKGSAGALCWVCACLFPSYCYCVVVLLRKQVNLRLLRIFATCVEYMDSGRDTHPEAERAPCCMFKIQF